MTVTIDKGLHQSEVDRGDRFEFGENWKRFISTLDENRIAQARESLRSMLEVDSLSGQSFLDIGCGSGLFSLAARQLGAKVFSLDFDPHSVACALELRKRFFPDDPEWQVEEGSVLDSDYIKSLATFDIVYSWGVLHHTGEMWNALHNAQIPVNREGKLFIAIYNDTGSQASRWKWIKKTYNKLPRSLRPAFAALAIAPDEIKPALSCLVRLKPQDYLRRWTTYERNRGMSRWSDIIDWVGGYPYEVASPDQIFDFFRARGFTLTKLKCGGVGLGCNEFVFVKTKTDN